MVIFDGDEVDEVAMQCEKWHQLLGSLLGVFGAFSRSCHPPNIHPSFLLQHLSFHMLNSHQKSPGFNPHLIHSDVRFGREYAKHVYGGERWHVGVWTNSWTSRVWHTITGFNSSLTNILVLCKTLDIWPIHLWCRHAHSFRINTESLPLTYYQCLSMCTSACVYMRKL